MFFRDQINYLAVTIIVFAAVSTGAYFLLKDEAERIRAEKISKMRTSEPMHGAGSSTDPMKYVPHANLHPPKTDIVVDSQFLGQRDQSVVQDDIKLATKGDGAFRDVMINGSRVPREYVEDAFFRNQDFMPRTDQFPITSNPGAFDPSTKTQRSMFGPMKSEANHMGFSMDVMRQSSNADVSISRTGGRYEE